MQRSTSIASGRLRVTALTDSFHAAVIDATETLEYQIPQLAIQQGQLASASRALDVFDKDMQKTIEAFLDTAKDRGLKFGQAGQYDSLNAVNVLWCWAYLVWVLLTWTLDRVHQGAGRGGGDGDAYGRYPHGGAVGVAGGPGRFRRDPVLDGGQGPAGGGAEQVEGAAGLHVRFPGHQGISQVSGVDRAPAGHQQPPEQDGLLGVVGDVPGGVPGGDGMASGRGLETGQQGAVAGHDLRAGQQLGRHAERVADGQPVEGALGPAGFAVPVAGKIDHQARCFSRGTRPVKLTPHRGPEGAWR